jgi:hypothetical protein
LDIALKIMENSNPQKMKVSFDFDDCLDDNKHLQALAQILIRAGVPVFILTARDDDQHICNDDLFKRAKEVGVSKENIIFANMRDKHLFMKEHDITLHFDDNADTVDRINRFFDTPQSLNKRALLVNLDLPDVINTWWSMKE